MISRAIIMLAGLCLFGGTALAEGRPLAAGDDLSGAVQSPIPARTLALSGQMHAEMVESAVGPVVAQLEGGRLWGAPQPGMRDPVTGLPYDDGSPGTVSRGASPGISPGAIPDAAPGASSDTLSDAIPAASQLPGIPTRRENPLRKMIGQMIMVGFVGDTVQSAGVQALIAQVASGDVGSILYLGNNVSSLDAVAEMNRAFLAARPELPPLIAVDQEGGYIQRLKENIGFPGTPSAAKIAQRHSPQDALEIYRDLARNIKRHGFNLNLGPVVDVNTNPGNPIIARFERSYSADAGTVVGYADAFISAHREAGVLTALKHFPGHGSSTRDTHLGFTDISQTWDRLELEPYRQLINAGSVDMIMTGHLYHTNLNQGGEPRTPTTLSAPVLQGLLRGRGAGQLGYDGVIITDDLQMGAIRKHFAPEEALVEAVLAGNDILMYTALGSDPSTQPEWIISTLTEAAARDPEIARRIEQSYGRILRLKAAIGARAPVDRTNLGQPIQQPTGGAAWPALEAGGAILPPPSVPALEQ